LPDAKKDPFGENLRFLQIDFWIILVASYPPHSALRFQEN
jgi:hypothetical protein